MNTTNKFREEQRHETVNRYAEGSVRHVLERREVRGVNCNCGYDGAAAYEQATSVSYRD